jgi:hypothetical protein
VGECKDGSTVFFWLEVLWVDDVIRVRDVRTRDEVVVTASWHEAGEVVHDWLCLEMEVTKHFIGPPAANQADDIGVNAGNKEGHGTAHMSRAGHDVFWEKTDGGAEGRN